MFSKDAKPSPNRAGLIARLVTKQLSRLRNRSSPAPMKSLATDKRNDLFIAPDGTLAIAHDIEAIKQDCQHSMQAQLGEMVLAMDRGMPTMDTVWHNVNLMQFETYARQTLRAVEGVVAVADFDTAIVDGALRYRVTIHTIFGHADLNSHA